MNVRRVVGAARIFLTSFVRRTLKKVAAFSCGIGSGPATGGLEILQPAGVQRTTLPFRPAAHIAPPRTSMASNPDATGSGELHQDDQFDQRPEPLGWYRVLRTMIRDAIDDLDLTRDACRRPLSDP